MPAKIAFIGSGSNVFTRNLVRDILSFPAFADCTFALMDINQERLDYSKLAVDRIIKLLNVPAKVTTTLNRVEALENADGVLATIMAGGPQARFNDIRIPLQFGIDQNIGDTRGPGGIFKFLRTWPHMEQICRDIEKYCPKAIFLNYTNPMAMLCRGMQAISPICVTGLCHSVQGTAKQLATWAGKSLEEVDYLCAGINHQAFYLSFMHKGIDLYPAIKEAIENKIEVYNEEQVRNEMFLHLGYYVTESSGHASEYTWWFRKRPELIEQYCTSGTGWNPGKSAHTWVDEFEEKQKQQIADNIEPWWQKNVKDFLVNPSPDLVRGPEYAAYIFNAVFGDETLFEFNGNVRNFGIIDNLPHGCCVEVPVLASRKGLNPIRVGKLPPQLATLISVNAQIEEMVVEGALTHNREMIKQALFFDPLTAAVCSLDEISTMFDEMWEFNKKDLAWF